MFTIFLTIFIMIAAAVGSVVFARSLMNARRRRLLDQIDYEADIPPVERDSRMDAARKEALAYLSRLHKYFAVGLAGLLLFLIGMMTFTSVPASHIGIMTFFGSVQEHVLHEGGHFINPLTKVIKVNVGLETAKVDNAEAASKDLQTVHSSITVNYRVSADKARELYIMNPSLRYEEQYVMPAITEVMKAVASQYTAEELITRRGEVSTHIQEQLIRKLTPYYLVVSDINITNFRFSQAFNQAIEAKVTATQQAEQAKRELEKVKYQGEQQIVAAKAQAEAIKIQTAAINAQGGHAYVQLKAVERWNGQLPTTMAGNSVPFINLK